MPLADMIKFNKTMLEYEGQVVIRRPIINKLIH